MKADILAYNLMLTQKTSLESLVASVEDAAGETVVEREYEIYGTVEDLSMLKEKAERIEQQEQWGLPSDKGNVRVRKTQEGHDATYVLTIKVKKDDGNLENETEVTKETFELFKALVKEGLIKTRYVIPVEGDDSLKLEVDVFNGPEGVCDIVKIDLEVPEGKDIDGIDIPFKLTDTRVIQPGKKTDEDLAYVKDLFSTKYNITQ